MEFFEKFLSDTENSRALEAALYTLRNAGKRIRPNLVFKTAAFHQRFAPPGINSFRSLQKTLRMLDQSHIPVIHWGSAPNRDYLKTNQTAPHR